MAFFLSRDIGWRDICRRMESDGERYKPGCIQAGRDSGWGDYSWGVIWVDGGNILEVCRLGRREPGK